MKPPKQVYVGVLVALMSAAAANAAAAHRKALEDASLGSALAIDVDDEDPAAKPPADPAPPQADSARPQAKPQADPAPPPQAKQAAPAVPQVKAVMRQARPPVPAPPKVAPATRSLQHADEAGARLSTASHPKGFEPSAHVSVKSASAQSNTPEGNATDAEPDPDVLALQLHEDDTEATQSENGADEGAGAGAGDETPAFLRAELSEARHEASFLHSLLTKQSTQGGKISDNLQAQLQEQLQEALKAKADAEVRAEEAKAEARAAVAKASDRLHHSKLLEGKRLKAVVAEDAVLKKRIGVLRARVREQQRKQEAQQQKLALAQKREAALQRRLRDGATTQQNVEALVERARGVLAHEMDASRQQKQGSMSWYQEQVAEQEAALPNATVAEKLALEASEILSLKAERHRLVVDLQTARTLATQSSVTANASAANEALALAQATISLTQREADEKLHSSQQREQAAEAEKNQLQAQESQLKDELRKQHDAELAAERGEGAAKAAAAAAQSKVAKLATEKEAAEAKAFELLAKASSSG